MPSLEIKLKSWRTDLAIASSDLPHRALFGEGLNFLVRDPLRHNKIKSRVFRVE